MLAAIGPAGPSRAGLPRLVARRGYSVSQQSPARKDTQRRSSKMVKAACHAGGQQLYLFQALVVGEINLITLDNMNSDWQRIVRGLLSDNYFACFRLSHCQR